MLVVRKKQLEELQSDIHNLFLRRMEESISENFQIDKHNSQLRQEIKKNVAEAENFGFETEECIEQYLYLKWRYVKFQQLPLKKEILEILTYPDRDSGVKIDELILYFEKLG